MNPDLKKYFKSINMTTLYLKLYTSLVLILSLLSLLFGFPESGILLMCISINCILNYQIIKKLCAYLTLLEPSNFK